MSQNREVIVQLVSLQLLFIRGVKAGGYCLSAATGPLQHIDDCNEQKVALADNCLGNQSVTAYISHFSG